MQLQHAQALALIHEHRPEDTRAALRNSGYGELADQWLLASREFETVARTRLEPATLEGMDGPVSTEVLRAYARMCMSWSRIVQLRDQAVGWMERRD